MNIPASFDFIVASDGDAQRIEQLVQSAYRGGKATDL